tara:strand:- start:15 stop:1277 length:1263 start_codon:yes stop_codon:yes gene_type:complete
MRVRGCVGKVTVTASGHTYFDLSDESARVACVAWRGSPEAGRVVAGLADVDVSRVDFYAPYGRCQAVVRAARALEGGPSEKADVLRKLHSEGIITRARLPLPELLQHLCVITSAGSAAAGDLLSGIEQRWPGLRTTLIHTAVQGSDAPAQLAAAFAAARTLSPPPDVIICGRGGGSESDLSAFDTDAVARCFVGDDVVTVSAVGHEPDHVVTDAVADYRAKTPTAAIELVLPVALTDRVSALHALRRRLHDAAVSFCAKARARLSTLRASLTESTSRGLGLLHDSLTVTRRQVLRKPEQLVAKLQGKLAHGRLSLQHTLLTGLQRQRHRVSDLSHRLEEATRSALGRATARLDRTRAAMRKHSLPESWDRGFFTVCRAGAGGKRARLRDASDVREGDRLCVLGKGGIMVVAVQRHTPTPL